MPQRVAFLGGSSTPDGFRHAFVGTRRGELHEVLFNPRSGKGVARLACFDAIASSDSFFTSGDGIEQTIAATPDGNVHEVFLQPGHNPYDQQVLFLITTSGIQVSRDGAGSFSLDAQLANLVTGAQGGRRVVWPIWRSTITTRMRSPP